MTCSACAHPLVPGARYCAACGTSVVDTSTAATKRSGNRWLAAVGGAAIVGSAAWAGLSGATDLSGPCLEATTLLPGLQVFESIIAFRPDDRMIAAGHVDGSIQLWQTCPEPVLVRTLSIQGGPTNVASILAFSHDGRLLASVARESHTITVWGVESGVPLWSASVRRRSGGGGVVHQLEFSPNDRMVAVGGDVVSWFDAETGFEPADSGAEYSRFPFAWHPSGSTIAYEWESSNTLYSSGIDTGHRMAIIGLPGPPRDYVFSPDGSTVYVSVSRHPLVYAASTDTGETVRSFLIQPSEGELESVALALSRDGRYLVAFQVGSSTRGTVPAHVYRTDTGELVTTFDHNGHALSFRPGTHVVESPTGGGVDLSTGQPVPPVIEALAAERFVLDVISHDGTMAVDVQMDTGEVRLYPVTSL